MTVINACQPELPDISLHNIPKRGEIYTTLPNGLEIYQMTVKYSKLPLNMPIVSILRPSKIYPNLNFWSENKPSGNPAASRDSKACKWLVAATE
jgi:hypothetical protein